MIKSLTLHLTKSKQTCNKMDIWISKQSSYCVGSAAQDSSSLDMSGATARGDVSIAGSGDYPTYAAHWQKDAPLPELSQHLRILDSFFLDKL